MKKEKKPHTQKKNDSEKRDTFCTNESKVEFLLLLLLLCIQILRREEKKATTTNNRLKSRPRRRHCFKNDGAHRFARCVHMNKACIAIDQSRETNVKKNSKTVRSRENSNCHWKWSNIGIVHACWRFHWAPSIFARQFAVWKKLLFGHFALTRTVFTTITIRLKKKLNLQSTSDLQKLCSLQCWHLEWNVALYTSALSIWSVAHSLP